MWEFYSEITVGFHQWQHVSLSNQKHNFLYITELPEVSEFFFVQYPEQTWGVF